MNDAFLSALESTLTCLAALYWIPNSLEMAIGYALLPLLRKSPPMESQRCPRLSVVVAVRNEEEHVETALRSLQAQDYPKLEIIVVNDRSTDRTSEILENVARNHARTRVLHIRELPEKWLGKTHALQKGAELARGEWILFTDADVRFEPDALRRAINIATTKKWDHAVAIPSVDVKSWLAEVASDGFFGMINFRYRMWEASWRWAPGYAGVGAFNLVRTEAYRTIGKHERLRLNVVDDLGLGKLIKRSGFRQGLILAYDTIRVPWIASTKDVFRVLDKNMFAGLGYSYPAVAGFLLFVFACFLWPFIAAFSPKFWIQWTSLACMGGMALSVWAGRRTGFLGAFYVLALPLVGLLSAVLVLKSAWKVFRQGGVRWRDTFYPISELRRFLEEEKI